MILYLLFAFSQFNTSWVATEWSSLTSHMNALKKQIHLTQITIQRWGSEAEVSFKWHGQHFCQPCLPAFRWTLFIAFFQCSRAVLYNTIHTVRCLSCHTHSSHFSPCCVLTSLELLQLWFFSHSAASPCLWLLIRCQRPSFYLNVLTTRNPGSTYRTGDHIHVTTHSSVTLE